MKKQQRDKFTKIIKIQGLEIGYLKLKGLTKYFTNRIFCGSAFNLNFSAWS